jgi:hypothetical protein
MEHINDMFRSYAKLILPLFVYDGIGFIFLAGSSATQYSSFNYHMMQVFYFWVGNYLSQVVAVFLITMDPEVYSQTPSSLYDWCRGPGLIHSIGIPPSVLYINCYYFVSLVYAFQLFSDKSASSEDRGLGIYFCIFGAILLCPTASYIMFKLLQIVYKILRFAIMWCCCPNTLRKQREESRKAKELELKLMNADKVKDEKKKKKTIPDSEGHVV